MMRIFSPEELQKQFPLPQDSFSFIQESRQQAIDILHRKTKKLALLVGPCSIHDPELALDYATRLKTLLKKTEHFFPIMRIFLEKPRTHKGWKGLIYDPRLDGSNDICLGLQTARKLLLDLAKLNIPCATELLEPLALPYFEDLLTWGMIGARTSASQPHRQLASSLPFPVGFKNGVHGELDVAIHGILSARDSHTYLSMNQDGYIASKKTEGNPHTHLVLRGSEKEINYDPKSIVLASRALNMQNLEAKILIDCSHGNSKKDHKLQSKAFKSSIDQIYQGNTSIFGLMLESHLVEGKQPLGKLPSLRYGVSITDSCIGWEETESMILWAEELLSSPISMSSVQK
jgi:3-deoxy-7-phosphoheptulonate synthase